VAFRGRDRPDVVHRGADPGRDAGLALRTRPRVPATLRRPRAGPRWSGSRVSCVRSLVAGDASRVSSPVGRQPQRPLAEVCGLCGDACATTGGAVPRGRPTGRIRSPVGVDPTGQEPRDAAVRADGCVLEGDGRRGGLSGPWRGGLPRWIRSAPPRLPGWGGAWVPKLSGLPGEGSSQPRALPRPGAEGPGPRPSPFPVGLRRSLLQGVRPSGCSGPG